MQHHYASKPSTGVSVASYLAELFHFTDHCNYGKSMANPDTFVGGKGFRHKILQYSGKAKE